MGVSSWDGNSNYVLGDDGTDDGVKITSTPVGLKNPLDVSDQPCNTSGLYSELVVGTTPIELKVGATPLGNRKFLILQPKDNKIFFGYNNLVSPEQGVEIFKDQILILKIGDGIAVWAVSPSGNKPIRIQELS